MKKILVAILPAALLSILATVVFPMLLGHDRSEAVTVIMMASALITLGITAFSRLKKNKSKQNDKCR